ncbi:TPA: tail fiber assembly protein [Yersinia enterocolitica]|nr:tail fiber assembly protein [Yersinia enterocolitica]
MTIAVLDKEKIAAEAGFITVYNYSAQTGEYTGSAEEYLAIGVGLPAFSTEIQPAVSQAGFVTVFNGSGWVLREDYRGATVYSTADRSAVVVDYIGAVKDGYVTIAPTTQFSAWNGTVWVIDTAAQQASAVTAAEQEKEKRLTTAQQSISLLQTKLLLGRKLTDTETARLNSWLDYIDAVQAIDTSTAPDIEWPVSPE